MATEFDMDLLKLDIIAAYLNENIGTKTHMEASELIKGMLGLVTHEENIFCSFLN